MRTESHGQQSAKPEHLELQDSDRAAPLVELLETLYNSRNPTRRWLHSVRRDWFITKIKEHARVRSGRAIEVGCGAGVYLPTLCEQFREVVASDLSRACLDHARTLLTKYPNLELVSDDITQSRIPPESFDLVVCSEVIEHIPEPTRVVEGLWRLLAPGGVLLLSTPQRYSTLELACKIALSPAIIWLPRAVYGEAVFETGHISLMGESELAARLEGQGFLILERYKSGMYIPVLAEFAGAAGLRFERWLENRLRKGTMDWLLWTQYYVAQRPPA